MNLQQMIKRLEELEDLTPKQMEHHWIRSLKNDFEAQDKLKWHYMKLLYKIKPIYDYLDDEAFYHLLEQSVAKALDRGLKFQVEDYESYMTMASQTYFKYFLQPETDSLHIPNQLINAFSRLDEIYQEIPTLISQDDQTQIQLLSDGFEYPIFPTRLLYYSFIKWKENTLRQVDIDLTVSLLPPPQRIEWEVFYEKDLKAIETSIQNKLKTYAK